MSYLLQDDDGQITEPRSISAGVLMFKLITAWTTLELDLSMVSLKTWDGLSIQRFRWRSLRRECLDWRGYIIPALGTSHALLHLEKLCPTLADGTRMVLIFGGRGDKDVQTAIKYLEV
ncbi:hypothetical protein HID58_041928 [Brassica napus]|uniref:Uncharacterized protein n=1 Tax=Brassica napus TaxID=3708 RepID=A0ABQ8BDT6_BRANA|nr:hypothetical protein HID58_041928 [Brassica napus]